MEQFTEDFANLEEDDAGEIIVPVAPSRYTEHIGTHHVERREK